MLSGHDHGFILHPFALILSPNRNQPYKSVVPDAVGQ